MVRALAVPNWSFYEPELAARAERLLVAQGCRVHYCQGDIDHQRTVTGFSGPLATVSESLIKLCELLLPSIDLSGPHGVHPRVGALDVAPFVSLGTPLHELLPAVESVACQIWEKFQVPVRLYEKSTRSGNESRLPVLRGQVGEIKTPPDFGDAPHPKWGTTIVGVRDFLLATNIELPGSSMHFCRQLAKEIRIRREGGNSKFRGVRALAFHLESRGTWQLSLNFTDPDATSFDEVFGFVEEFTPVVGTELIGVIRQRDLPKCTKLAVDARQVVD
ncbi:MAG TPA: hypothetical protein VK171_12030 [Fimbriimonas sp.]|nr:hypothetical protein [Fimbriimonas sp.]